MPPKISDSSQSASGVVNNAKSGLEAFPISKSIVPSKSLGFFAKKELHESKLQVTVNQQKLQKDLEKHLFLAKKESVQNRKKHLSSAQNIVDKLRVQNLSLKEVRLLVEYANLTHSSTAFRQIANLLEQCANQSNINKSFIYIKAAECWNKAGQFIDGTAKDWANSAINRARADGNDLSKIHFSFLYTTGFTWLTAARRCFKNLNPIWENNGDEFYYLSKAIIYLEAAKKHPLAQKTLLETRFLMNKLLNKINLRLNGIETSTELNLNDSIDELVFYHQIVQDPKIQSRIIHIVEHLKKTTRAPISTWENKAEKAESNKEKSTYLSKAANAYSNLGDVLLGAAEISNNLADLNEAIQAYKCSENHQSRIKELLESTQQEHLSSIAQLTVHSQIHIPIEKEEPSSNGASLCYSR